MLTPTEKKVLHQLGWGKNYTEIAVALFKSPANINTVCSHIRLKTGIKDTTNKEECRQWEKDHQESLASQERGPTKKQREVLWLLGQGMPLKTVAQLQGVSIQCVTDQACTGRRRAHLPDSLPSTILAWFKADEEKTRLLHAQWEKQAQELWDRKTGKTPTPTEPDPMSDPAFN